MERVAPERNDPKAAFTALGITGPLLNAVVELGYEEPTPIQRAAIPALLAGRDVLGQAATGTGKTAAFALPLLHRLAADRGAAPAGSADRRTRATVRALVLVPTRELAIQVAEALHRYGRAFAGRILAVYGGQPIYQQLGPLRNGVDVVVATPGRALDHVRRGSLVLDAVEMLVLDEADEMLDMGFADDLEALLEKVPAGRQAALFSATLPKRIAALAERHLRDPERIEIPAERVAAGDVPRLRHVAYVVSRREKIEALVRVLDIERPASSIVFCRTRTEVDELAETLLARGYRCEPLHGGRTQELRMRVMRRFREGKFDVLIATDVAARGLDIEHVSHVINFDVPCSTDAYVHRVGRTGRAGRSGVALTFAEPRERRLFRDIERAIAQKIRIADVPTVEDVRARRLELTAATLRAAVTAGELGTYRAIVARLATEFDPIDIASAALKLVHERNGSHVAPVAPVPAAPRVSADPAPAAAAPETPARKPRPVADGAVAAPRVARRDTPRPTPRDIPVRTSRTTAAEPPVAPPMNRRERRAAARAGLAVPPSEAMTTPVRTEGAVIRRRPAPSSPRSRQPVGAATGAAVTRLRIGLGTRAGLRPADLVGAIANETGMAARSIGAIEIGEQSATVEVPSADADAVVRALTSTTIRGRRTTIERVG